MEIENREIHAFTDELDKRLFPAITRTEIVTFSGLSIDPVAPNPERISITDIAHALGNSCRYGGHCPNFYSVAEHSVMVERMMREAGHSKEACFAGLIHDSEEAYLMDMPTPIKRQFADYVAAGDRLREVIFTKYGLNYKIYDLVKPFDQEAYKQERQTLWNGKNTLTPTSATNLFLDVFKSYGR